jgi:hypothetical protein
MSKVVPFDLLTRLRHRKRVPPVPVELLTDAGDRLAGMREERGLQPEDASSAAVLTVHRLRDTWPIDDLGLFAMDIGGRLSALLNHLADQGVPATQAFSILRGQDPNLLRAAAHAPLKFQYGPISSSRFELATFLAVVQKERLGGSAA